MKNLPYFFQGINYSTIDPNDADTHGISAVCRELQLFLTEKWWKNILYQQHFDSFSNRAFYNFLFEKT